MLGLELEGKDLPCTRTHGTPSGGEHIILSVEASVRQGTNVLGPKVDIRSRGGYIVAPGSTIDGRAYTVLNAAPIAPAPQWVIDMCGGLPRHSSETGTEHPPVDLSGINQETARRQFEWYLLHEAPLSIQGQSGDQTAFVVAAKGRDYGAAEPLTLQLMWDLWNDRCTPPWAPEELETKVRNAYRYSQNAPGIDAPVFPPLDPPAPGEAKELHPFDKMNEDHAFVVAGGGGHILWETTNADGQPTVEHLDKQTFRDIYASYKIRIGDRDAPVASQWLEWKGRRSYDGIIFSPGQPPEVSTDINERPKKYFNLWRGFAYEPAPPGSSHPSLDLFLEHLNLNVCGGSEALYRWLLGFFAHLVQCPEQKPEVAIVLRGGKGVGKTMVAETIGDLLGRHFLLTSDRRYLTGNFNGHLENCLMLALDEAFWSGDKQAEGTLKNLITGREHVIEHKGKEPYVVANKTRISICSNEDWIVPSSHDERRFAFFDVGDGRKQDRVYFGQIRDGLRNGGYPVLLRYLLGYPLAGIDINTAPVTAGLLDQKLQSDDPLMQWWYQCLKEERIVGSECEGWPESMESDTFRRAMKRSAESRNIRPRIPDVHTFGKRMKKPLGVTNRRQRDEKDKDRIIHAYNIPPLVEARKNWEDSVGQPMQWDE